MQVNAGEILRDLPMELKFPGARKQGQGYKMLCPFHTEKTPSMSVNETGVYYCFGCGAKGDYISYLMRKKEVSFREAVKEVEAMTGVKIYSPELDEITRINSDAAEYYHSQLTGKTKDYLFARGIAEETIKKFQIGETPGFGLFAHLKSKGYSPETIRKAGLMKAGSERDFFALPRLIIPIVNGVGILGFASREAGEGGGSAKYINSPETAAFKKSKILYGLSKKDIQKHGYAIIVEGYFDCMALHQAGYGNAVAIMGTMMTEEQTTTIGRYTDKIAIALDGDTAGAKGTRESLAALIRKGFETKVVDLQGKDPDDFLRDGGFPEALKSAERGEVYLYKRLDPKGKKELINDIAHTSQAAYLLTVLNEKERVFFSELSAKAAVEACRESMKLLGKVKNMGHIEARGIGSTVFVFVHGKLAASKTCSETKLREEAGEVLRAVATAEIRRMP